MVSSLKELLNDTELSQTDDPEEKFVTTGVSWQMYEALLAKLEDNSHYRVNYIDGILEIVSPSIRHENIKKRLAILIERYLYLKRIRFNPMGSSTVKKQLKQAGVEPDECYAIGEKKNIPDLAIEVIITSGSLEKLKIYQRLGVSEVWVWQINQLKLYHLREETPSQFLDTHGYEQITLSEILSELNIALLKQCVQISDDIEAIDQFEQNV
ncbi:Uma2 family endonuclease [Nostoc sp. FACHB-152]|uniref:Uma2 family endonuclease n=1 Tax=unclassified Nostoc TaxID=2593658 RepID=UPI001687344A|nr:MULTISPECIES: Uma2 family endonuclease [unclassified Nostoc]MBD2447209.1 Uma2 family endonuclease [Nostoc sp. FACHB-152]MBD2468190.1 Uma2 family endonuclease [Nostoc sp. FACHB-145]